MSALKRRTPPNCKMTLKYTIADFLLHIETPEAESTRRLLPTFEPFTAPGTTAGEPLFTFSGEMPAPQAQELPLLKDTVDWNSFIYRFYPTDNGELWVEMVHNERTAWLWASADNTVFLTSVSVTAPENRLFLNNCIVMSFGIASARHKALKMHASVTELNGEALLFMGVSGTGKSTHSRLWHQYVPGSTLLNDDEPIVRIFPGGEVRVYGAPWSGKTPCYRNEWAHVAAFVHLHQAPHNQLTQEKALQAINSMIISVGVLRSDKKNKQQILDNIIEVLNLVPLYRLDCLPDKGAVELTYNLLKSLTEAKE